MEQHWRKLWSGLKEEGGKGDIKLDRAAVQHQKHLSERPCKPNCQHAGGGATCNGRLLCCSTSAFRTWRGTTSHSWAKRQSERQSQKSLSHSFRTAYCRALTGSALARHVDRPWQVAWVHVAQPELLLYFRFEERQRERARESERARERERERERAKEWSVLF